MRKQIYEYDQTITEDRRLVKRVWKVNKSKEFPEGIEFAYQYLYLKDETWHQVIRIDNQLHEGKQGTHIHILKRGKVEWIGLTQEEIKKLIIQKGDSIIKNILERI